MKHRKLNRMMTSFIVALTTLGITSCAMGEKEKVYTINVTNKVGMALEDTRVKILDKNGEVYRSLLADENGQVSFKGVKQDYTIQLEELPKGYIAEENGYKFNKNEYTLDISCFSQIIKEDRPKDKIYQTGDVMYDFTFTNIHDEEVTLSKVLEQKDMVLINFWYITCSACIKEFPAMLQAYANRKDELEIFAINPLDTLPEIKEFSESMFFDFEVGPDDKSINLNSAFAVTGYPTSIVIDRYGMVTAFEKGAIASVGDFYELFDHFTGPNYTPVIANDDGNFIDTPDLEMPPSSEIEKVVNGEGFDGHFLPETNPEDAEFNWPWVISDDGKSMHPSNSRHANSYSIVYTHITLSENQVFAFDYFSSCEQYGDYLYILIDRNIVQAITGESTSWETCYAYVPMEYGTHEVAFCYIKNGSTNYLDDTVYVNNLRIISVEKIDRETYIYRHCAYGLDETINAYTKYITPVYNPVDGYYHVNKENGPLVMADLLNPTQWSGTSVYGYYGYGLEEEIDAKYRAKILPFANIIGNYASYQSNSVVGYVPVTPELKSALVATTTAISNQNENEWLELCGFYSAYCTNGVEMGDPIVGLAPFSAYEGHLGENWVKFWDVVMPRGLLTSFTPEFDGVYKFQSIGEKFETTAWLYDENMARLAEADQEARYYVTSEKPDPNFALYYDLKAGQKYYIRVAFEDLYTIGDLPFNISYVGESFDLLTLCAPGYFIPEIGPDGEIIADKLRTGGIDVELGTDNLYHHKLKDGSLGSTVYLEWDYQTEIFPYTMDEIIALKGFDMRLDELNNPVEGGRDYTANILNYRKKIIHDGSELDGLVPVDRALAALLQLLMDKYSFPGVENSWLKLCYYYKHFGK